MRSVFPSDAALLKALYLATLYDVDVRTINEHIKKIYSDSELQIREIRLSERRFYQKITDIYATALDYDRTAKTTKQFFAKVQNKMHYAVHGHTAAEFISDINKNSPNMLYDPYLSTNVLQQAFIAQDKIIKKIAALKK